MRQRLKVRLARLERAANAVADDTSPRLIVLAPPNAKVTGYKYMGKKFKPKKGETLDQLGDRLIGMFNEKVLMVEGIVNE